MYIKKKLKHLLFQLHDENSHAIKNWVLRKDESHLVKNCSWQSRCTAIISRTSFSCFSIFPTPMLCMIHRLFLKKKSYSETLYKGNNTTKSRPFSLSSFILPSSQWLLGNLPCGRRRRAVLTISLDPLSVLTWELTNSRSTLSYLFPGKVKVKEEKEASSMAPGSPPTPPHTPQSPPRQNTSGNLSQSSQTPNASSPNIQQLQGVNNSPLSQILVQNPALAQLLQQNPTILTQNPQLAQLLQQNFQVQMGNVLFQGARRDDGEDARVSIFDRFFLFFLNSIHFTLPLNTCCFNGQVTCFSLSQMWIIERILFYSAIIFWDNYSWVWERKSWIFRFFKFYK